MENSEVETAIRNVKELKLHVMDSATFPRLFWHCQNHCGVRNFNRRCDHVGGHHFQLHGRITWPAGLKFIPSLFF